jgi:two-component system sensor histidine kinase YesM
MFKFILQLTRKVSIYTQLLFGFSIIIFTVVTVNSYFSYRSSSAIITTKSTLFLKQTVSEMQGKLDVMLQEYDKLSLLIGFNNQIQDTLKELENHVKPTLTSVQIQTIMDKQLQFIGHDLLVQIHTPSGQVYSSNSSMSLLWGKETDMSNFPWYKKVNISRGKIIWFAADVWNNGTVPAIVGVRQINDWNKISSHGLIFIVIPIDIFTNTFYVNNQDAIQKVHFIDTYNHYVYSTEQEEIGKLDNGHNSDPQHQLEVPSIVHQGKQYLTKAVSPYSGWVIEAYVNDKTLFGDLKQIQSSMFFMGLIGLLAAMLLTAFFTRSISFPIRNLATKLQRIERGSLTPLRGTLLNLEVDILYKSFNRMLHNLDRTINDLTKQELSERQAQMIALKAQFRPHFLYNTLNVIYWSLSRKKNKDEAQMVIALSELLRYSIEGGNEFVKLDKDLEQLNRYIYLQKLRYGDKLQVNINVQDELYDVQVPRLLLQPIVENAVTHGLEMSGRDTWRIDISIRANEDAIQSDNSLIIEVEDNGRGMTEEARFSFIHNKPNLSSEHTMHTGIGLRNLHDRIQYTYGNEYGLRLGISKFQGLKVAIHIPLHHNPNK